ncbi:type II secretion system F family protein [Patescibacteria group bacterium]
MAVFEFRAKDDDGKEVTGAVEAPSESVASEILQDRELIVLGIKERRKRTLFQSSLNIFKRVPIKDVAIFARQLAVMISATVPIVSALRILVRQTENTNFKIIISEVADEVEGGAKLSATLGRYPHVFSQFFIHMIRAGETTGKLDETLNYLADQQEKDYDLQSKIKGAMTYPIFIIAGLGIVGVLMMIFVIPRLTEILTESGGELPATTKILIGTSSFMQNFWWVLLLIVVGIVAGYRSLSRTNQGKEIIDKAKFKIPIFGNIFKKIYLVRFSRSLSTLVVSGIPMTQSLEIVADVIGNSVYRDLTRKTIKEVEAGKSISTVFAESEYVPPILTQMLYVGEQTGKLDLVLDKLSEFYSRELENTVANLTSLIEPIIMVVMGLGVAMLVMAVILPIYNLSSAV